MKRFLLLALALGSALAIAQVTDGNITGTVLDASGAVVPTAAIEAENVSTGLKRVARTDALGTYRINNVPVGTYRITAKAEGFAATSLENVSVSLNRTTTANLTMQLGRVATEVEVTEATALIDTTTATIGSTFQSNQAIELPTANVALGVYNFALLSAGVASSGGVGLGEGPSVGGQRPRQNSFMIEGVDNNRKDVTGANLRVPNEAVGEFSMLQNQFTAEFGHSTGGQFSTTIKSGTNNVHGSGYEYLENRKLNAVDEAAARQGNRTNPRYDQSRLGGTVGGPIKKNKLFYFGLFEYNPYGEATQPSAAALTPTAQGYEILGRIQGLSQTNLTILRQYAPAAPAATDTTVVLGQSIPIGVLPINFPSYSNTYNWVVSGDYNMSEKDQIRARYLESKFDGVDPGTSPQLPAFAGQRNIRQRIITASHFHTFTPSLFNELRLAYNRYSDSIPAGNFTWPGLDVFPNVTIEQDLNLQLGPLPEAPQYGSQNTYQLVNNLSLIRGGHSAKFGYDGRKYIAPTFFVQRVRGDYGYSTLERFLRDLSPDIIAERNTGGTTYEGNQFNHYFYAQDEWKIRRNVTLTLGVRYEYKGVPKGDKLQVLNAISNVPGLIEFRAPRAAKNNWAPRLGLAISPGTSGKTVVRAGFGMAYDTYFDNFGTLTKPVQLENTFSLDVDQTTTNFLAQGGIRPDQRPDDLPQDVARAFTSSFIPDQILPQSIQWNIGVSRVWRNDYTFEARYLGTRGVHLFVQNRINQIARVTPERSLPTFLQRPSQAELDRLTLTLNQLRADNGGSTIAPAFRAAGFLSPITAFQGRGNSLYHGLAAEFSRRFKDGIFFKGAYTWSHNIDDSTADLFSTLVTPRRPQDFQNWRNERATSFLDRRHRFTFTWVTEAPWMKNADNWLMRNVIGNWLVGGIYTAESPQIGTVQSGLDSNLNGDAAGDRSVINPAGQDGVGSDVTALTNSAGQIVGYLANNPNARYIRAAAGVFPNGGRNTIKLRGINNFDINLAKRFSISESKKFEIKAFFINAFNHPQYTPGSLNSVRATSSSNTRNHLIPGNALFNDPTQVYPSHARAIHLVARFIF